MLPRAWGCVMTMSARENLTLPNLKPFWKGGLLRRRSETSRTTEWFERLSVRPSSAVNEPLSIFSGGNQQKILFGKWLSRKPTLFLLDEPTQGVDVGSKSEIHHLMMQLADQGVAIIMISSELPEILGMSDRIAVMHAGSVAGVLARHEATQARILALALGTEHPQ